MTQLVKQGPPPPTTLFIQAVAIYLKTSVRDWDRQLHHIQLGVSCTQYGVSCTQYSVSCTQYSVSYN
jgi:hypothetical protein